METRTSILLFSVCFLMANFSVYGQLSNNRCKGKILQCEKVINYNFLSVPVLKGDEGSTDKDFKSFNFGAKAGLHFTSDDMNDLYGSGIIWGVDFFFWGRNNNGFRFGLDIFNNKGKEKEIMDYINQSFQIHSELDYKLFGASLTGSFLHRFRNIDYVAPYIGIGISMNYYKQTVEGSMSSKSSTGFGKDTEENVNDYSGMGGVGLQPVIGTKIKGLPIYFEMKYHAIIVNISDDIDFDKYGIFSMSLGLML